MRSRYEILNNNKELEYSIGLMNKMAKFKSPRHSSQNVTNVKEYIRKVLPTVPIFAAMREKLKKDENISQGDRRSGIAPQISELKARLISHKKIIKDI